MYGEAEDWYADTKEIQVDVRHDPMRWINDSSRSVLMPGEGTEVLIPFEGARELLSSNPPPAVIEGNEPVLRYEMPSDAIRDVRPLVDQSVKDIQQYIG